MPASLRQRGTRRVVILGAGFNAPLGMPLTADLLRQVHAVAAIGRAGGDLLRCYEAMLTPWLVLPSYDKIFQVLSLGQVWQLPWDWLDERLDVQIIGYSIRPDDYHSRALLHPRLVRGARRRRLRVAVVDRAPDARTREEIIGRFAGVQGCRFWFDGFSPQALEFLEDR